MEGRCRRLQNPDSYENINYSASTLPIILTPTEFKKGTEYLKILGYSRVFNQ